MFEKILVPVDGSELADRILLHARRLLLTARAEVVLLQVIAAGNGEAEQIHLDGLKLGLADQGARASTRIVTSADPAATILETAAKLEPSLIALSTHGRTGLARLRMGSVAERVLHGSRFPLFLANPFALEEEPREIGFRRILVPLDGSDASARVLPLVHEIARTFESEVVLLHVVEPRLLPAGGAETTLEEFDARADAAARLERRRAELGGVRARVVVLRGPAAAAILDAAECEDADLVALTTHGRSGPSRWVFGSIAEHVLHECRCPLLVVRTGGPGLEPRP